LGAYGENLAAEFLQRRGFKILEKNFSCRAGEIDLIALDGAEVVFVEVKTRTSDNYGLPEYAVDWRKLQKILKSSILWRNWRNDRHLWRIDAVSVEINTLTKSAKIRLFRDLRVN